MTQDPYAVHARFYDLEHEDYQEDIAMYAGFAAATTRAAGGAGRVLELACGSGRLLIPLAAAGHTATGLDASPAMLALAREKLRAAGLARKVRLVEGDMRHFDLGRAFDLVIVGLNSLMHLETQHDQYETLLAAARHLTPVGRLVVDLFNPEVALPDEHQDGALFLHCLKVLPGGAHLLHFQAPRVDRAAQTVHLTNYYDEVAPDGRVTRHLAPFSLRYVTKAELSAMVSAAGLALVDVYGTYNLDPYEAGSPSLIAVIQRMD
jgi:SAM-dependent methyltransferase